MLQVKGLTVSYHHHRVLEDISLEVNSREIVCLIGKSGCGKSTLLNQICEGGRSISTPKSVAYIAQNDLLLDWRTTLQNVLLPLEIANKVSELGIENAKNLLGQLGLREALNKFPAKLSGGMRQRTALARGLLQNAELNLFDEPLSAVDYDLRIQIGRKIRKFIVQGNKSALFVTHNIEEAISLADRILVLGKSPGRIILEQKIDLPEGIREPAKLRGHPDFPKIFSTLWEALCQ